MNIVDQFDHHEKKQDKEHFFDLIQIAFADGVVDKNETEMLHRLGKKKGFTDAEIESLINATKVNSYNPPYDYFKRFSQIYEIVKMTLADGVVDENEIRLAGKLATKIGFTENEIPVLLNLLINGINDSIDEDDLFEIYKKQRKF